MRFWVFTGQAAAGPYEPVRLKGLPGFSPGTVVAPEGASSEEAWKPARDFPELRPLFAKAPVHPIPAARSAAGRAPKPSPARAHPRAATLPRGRMVWVLAGLVCVLLLAVVLYSVFDRLGRESVPAAAEPSPAGPQRPMPFEAPGSPLLKTK